MSETDEKRNLPVTELRFCICEIFKLEIFSKSLDLSFTDCYSLGLDQKILSSSNLGLEQKLPKWNFIERSILRFDLIFHMSVFGYISDSGLKQKRPKWKHTESSPRGSSKHFESKTLLKMKL